MESLLWLIAGIYIGFKACDAYHRHAINSVLEDMGITEADRKRMVEHCKQQLETDEDKELVVIKIEKHSECLYAFRKDTDEFLGQSTTADGLIKLLTEKMKTVRFAVAEEEGGDLVRSSTKAKTITLD
jgi:hypothetical protein